MNDIKRYDISYSERYGFDKEEDPNGKYVEWEDHAAATAAKDARIGRLEWLLREVRFSTDSIMIQHQIDRALEESK